MFGFCRRLTWRCFFSLGSSLWSNWSKAAWTSWWQCVCSTRVTAGSGWVPPHSRVPSRWGSQGCGWWSIWVLMGGREEDCVVQGVTVPEVLVMVGPWTKDFPARCLKALPLAIVSMEYNSVERQCSLPSADCTGMNLGKEAAGEICLD